jgi:epoxyqueuosine reductase QueG
LKQGLVNRLKQVGAYAVGVADPTVGFEHAVKGWHPLELWKPCRSVVVFAVAASPRSNNLYAGPYAEWKGNRGVGPVPHYIQSDDFAMDRMFRLFVASITLKGITFLQTNGHNVFAVIPQLKLAAYEAGIGVYGRSGLIIHPVIGNRIRLGAILTEAVLEPDKRLDGFDPCRDCDDLCIRMCPAKAHDRAKTYPLSFTQQVCEAKRAEIADKKLYCHNCFVVCPAGQLDDDNLLYIDEAVNFFKAVRE